MNKDLLKQFNAFKTEAIEALSDLILELRSGLYDNMQTGVYSGDVERALFLLDPDNPVLSDSVAVNKQKTIEKILAGGDNPQNNVLNILERAKTEYHAPNKPETFFCFPNADQLNLSCRFYGKNVLFTGFWPEEKAQIAIITPLLNLSIAPGVSSKVDFLICGSNAGPAKVKKAGLLNVPIIQAADFIREITKDNPESNGYSYTLEF